jgi:hypothetical protein
MVRAVPVRSAAGDQEKAMKIEFEIKGLKVSFDGEVSSEVTALISEAAKVARAQLEEFKAAQKEKGGGD